jgi:hypothetical protein
MLYHLRPLIFWIFVTLFFVTTFSVLFYAFGYRFNLERGIFIYTGSISIQSDPDTIDISIDGETIPSKSVGMLNDSIHIAGLAPGEHFISVSADGYKTWTKKAIVQSGLSTEFWNVILVKDNYDTTSIDGTEQVIKMFHAPKENLFAIVKKSDNQYSVSTLDTGTGKTEQLFSISDATISEDDTENIEWLPDSTKLIIPVIKDTVRSYVIADIETNTATALTLSLDDQKNIHSARWDPMLKNFILFLKDSTLYRANISSPENTHPIVVQEHVAAYDLSNSNIYYLSSDNGMIYQTPVAEVSADPKQITFTPIAIDTDDDYSLIRYDDDRIAILNRTDGGLFIFNAFAEDSPIKQIGNDVKGMQFSDDGKKLLFFSLTGISVYFCNDWDVQPIREADTTAQIARFSSPIKFVQWTSDYEHVLFLFGNTVKLIELDNRDKRVISDIISFPAPLNQIIWRSEEKKLYFVRTDDADARTVQSISFLQSTGLFGL